MLKKDNHKVSIIMNCHNGEEYLHQSVRSILNQSYKNWELIFYNNFSTDNSLSIIKKINDSRIKIFSSQKFESLYKARNQAIKKTKGQYICFLDTDDYWEKNKLKKQVEYLKKNLSFSMVYSNFYTLKKNKKKFIQYNFVLPEGQITKTLLKKYTIGILTACVRKKIFKKIKFNNKFSIIGDFDFFIKLSLNSKIGCIQKSLATYRLHKNNLSKKKLKLHIVELREWIKNKKNFLNKKSISLFHQKFYLKKLQIKYLFSKLGV